MKLLILGYYIVKNVFDRVDHKIKLLIVKILQCYVFGQFGSFSYEIWGYMLIIYSLAESHDWHVHISTNLIVLKFETMK